MNVSTEIIEWWKESSQLLEYVVKNGQWVKASSGSDDHYDINENFSLILRNITISNGGVYRCEIFNLKTGQIETQKSNAFIYGKYKGHNLCTSR